MSRARRCVLLTAALVLLMAAPAYAAGGMWVFHTADFLGLGGLLGGVFHTIGHAVLGAFTWTLGLAGKFILVTVGAIVKLLIPRSWASEGVHIMRWIVAIPDYAGTITSPGGQTVYGFAGINALRDLFTWIAAAVLPLTLVYATSRAIVGHGEPVAVPLVRVLALGGLLVFYPYWWAQLAAVINQVTNMILTLPPVLGGLHKLMLYVVGGAALGGWQLIDLALMLALGVQLLMLIFLKVVIILLGALLYATGPITVGLAPSNAGATIARVWASAAAALLALPVVWAAVFAVGALLIGDAGTAGPLIAGSSSIGSLIGGLLLALAGLASLWVCLRLAREAAGLVRIQLGGLAALRHSSSAAPARGVHSASGAHSIRTFSSRVSRAGGAATDALAASGATGAVLAGSGRALASAGRRGVLRSGGAAGRAGIARGAPQSAALLGRSRAGAVAVQMARAGSASWQTGPAPARTGPPRRATLAGAASAATASSTLDAIPSASPDRAATTRARPASVGDREASGGQESVPKPAGGSRRHAGNPLPPRSTPTPSGAPSARPQPPVGAPSASPAPPPGPQRSAPNVREVPGPRRGRRTGKRGR